MSAVTKESTIETIKTNEESLRHFAKTLVELWDVSRDGDDYWTAYSFGDGSYADVNVWIDTMGKHEILKVTAYPVRLDGSTNTSEFRTLYKQSLKAKHNTHEGDNF